MDDKWVRKSWITGKTGMPMLGQYIGHVDAQSEWFLINSMIQSEGNFYAYGGYRDIDVLILSPSEKKAIYLSRD